GQRRARRQAGGGVHLHRQPAWRPGIDPADHARAVAAPRLRDRRHPLYRATAEQHPQRRYAVWRKPRGRRRRRSAAHRGGGGARARPRAAPGRHRRQAGPLMRAPSHRILGIALLALAVLYMAWFREDRHAAAALLVFALPPLLLAVPAWRGGRKAAFWSGVL